MGGQEELVWLLQGTGLGDRQTGDATVMIEAAGQGTGTVGSSARTAPDTPESQTAPEATDVATVTVTGTRIRGGTSPSPVITIGIENIREEGFADLGEVIRSVPQNFSGGQNPGVVAAVGSGNTYNQTVTGGSSPNFRGAGAAATWHPLHRPPHNP